MGPTKPSMGCRCLPAHAIVIDAGSSMQRKDVTLDAITTPLLLTAPSYTTGSMRGRRPRLPLPDLREPPSIAKAPLQGLNAALEATARGGPMVPPLVEPCNHRCLCERGERWCVCEREREGDVFLYLGHAKWAWMGQMDLVKLTEAVLF